MSNRTVIYARLSREDEELYAQGAMKSRSIENQIQILTEYAKCNQLDIYKVIFDSGISGGTFDRSGFTELLYAIENREFDVLLIKDFSRLGRVMHRVCDFIENILPKYQIRLISLGDNYDSLYATSTSDFSVVLKSFLNDYYLKEVKRKGRLARIHSAHTQNLNYYPKLGYCFNEKRQLMIDEESAEVVRRIFHCIANERYTTTKVASLLNAEGVCTRSAYATSVLKYKPLHKQPSGQWSAGQVWEIVCDYEYCGHAVNWKKHAKEEQILLKNTHPAIIGESLFSLAQESLKSRSRRKKPLLHIGRMLVDKNTGRHLLYQKHKGAFGDNALYFLRVNDKRIYSIHATLIEEILYQEIIKSVIKMQGNAEMQDQKQDGNFEKCACNVNELQTQLEKYHHAYACLIEGYFQKKVAKATFDAKSLYFQNSIRDIEQKIEKIKTVQADLDNSQRRFYKFIKEMSIGRETRIQLIHMAIDQVYIEEVLDSKHIKITIIYK